MIKIVLLTENSTGHENSRICGAEWGLSMYIESDKTKLLFDSGHTDLYLRNANNTKIDLSKINYTVVSHHHWDHIRGLLNWPYTGKKIVLHPEILKVISREERDNIKNKFEIIESAIPYKISEHIYYLGQIPRINDFEKGGYKNDPMIDDSAIAITTNKGVVVISACSHSGICNICDYAEKVTGQKLRAVIGGFHMLDINDPVVDNVISYFKSKSPLMLYPMHCVDFYVMAKIYSELGCIKCSAGDTIIIK